MSAAIPMTPFLKRLAARLPSGARHELRRIFFRSQIRRRSFFTDEKEYALLDRDNYYQAPIVAEAAGLTVVAVPRGMQQLLEHDRPTLIVETGAAGTVEYLKALGYSCERLAGSSNVLCQHRVTANKPRQ